MSISNEQFEVTAEVNKLLGSFATRRNNSFGFETFQDALPNPNINREKLLESLELYDKFKIDPHVFSCIQSRSSASIAQNWELQYVNERTPEIDLIEHMFKELDIEQIMRYMLQAALYGYQPIEIYWDFKDGLIQPVSMLDKPAWWFYFDNNNILYYDKQDDGGDPVPVPRFKFIICQHNAQYYNPYGESVLSKCYFPMKFKQGAFDLWARFIQKYGIPTLHGKMGDGAASKDSVDQIATALYNLAENGVVATTNGVDIISLEASTSSSENFLSFVHFCNAEISKAILSQTLTTEQGSTGSYAMSQTHFDVRKDVIDADVKIICSGFNKLIEYICELNFPYIEELPKFTMYADIGIDKELAERDNLLFTGGYCTPTKKYLVRAYNFKDDEIDMTAPQNSESDTLDNPLPDNPDVPIDTTIPAVPAEEPALAFAEQYNTEFDYLAEFDESTRALINSIIDMIKNQTSLEKIQSTLIASYPEINTTAIESYIEKGMIAATMLGYLQGA